jgi:hypothetical protein
VTIRRPLGSAPAPSRPCTFHVQCVAVDLVFAVKVQENGRLLRP